MRKVITEEQKNRRVFPDKLSDENENKLKCFLGTALRLHGKEISAVEE
jgi:hypothetical protein